MDPEDAEEVAAELQGKKIDGWGVLQIAAGTGLTVYVVWAGILMPGFRKVPLKLQVPYVPASAKQIENVMQLLKGRSGKIVDLGSGDGRIVNLSDCRNVTVFLAPSVLMLLEKKLLTELPEEARVVAGRFPLPNWTHTDTAGEGVNQAWAYDVQVVRQLKKDEPEGSPV
ncbi:adenine nucleotide translocase lysine N-methyltransferase isoform X3 [Pantherophis guttatus]|uniref:Adenine nucleotide translocase lysine N-methyltransferase isoform X3 n=1 Tax=Pantherophis guttatus TaxID=94885 RepID=A0ABM3ZKN6_PANGU|nr:adenine nucleotide translocase lysine N-methyltransferase isoform X3 [Pantherophis guttatus]